MISRFDHAVIAVRDLDQAVAQYRELGFDVRPGGRHTGLGTHNAIVRLGLDYLELLSIYDERELEAQGENGRALQTLLSVRPGGLLAYGLATMDIRRDAERLRTRGVEIDGPFAMQRTRPDGRLLSWKLLIPHRVCFGRPWPFLIEWDQPDEQRLSWEQPGQHPNGATAVVGIAVAVRGLDEMVDLYMRDLAIEPAGTDDVPDLGARRARFRIGSFAIDLLEPIGDGPVARALHRTDPMPFELTLAVRDIEQTRASLANAGIAPDRLRASRHEIRLSPERACGARIVLRQGPDIGPTSRPPSARRSVGLGKGRVEERRDHRQ
jgi:hypothetical protein